MLERARMTEPIEIRGAVQLPARRDNIALQTADGLTLVGELATPLERPPVATLVTLHPLPTAGGFMDSHILRKAAGRLPALADIAVLRFNFRGTTSPRGTSDGAVGHGDDERHDLDAAMAFVRDRALPNPWLLGWSFGTEVLLKHGRHVGAAGAILLSPPLHRTSETELRVWADAEIPVIAVVPELDDYLQPTEARARFAPAPNIEVVGIDRAKHLWVGEDQTSRVLTEIVGRVNPSALPLPTTWVG